MSVEEGEVKVELKEGLLGKATTHTATGEYIV